jgi:hypothetical protein
MLFAGYVSGMIKRAERSMPDELMAFRRREQMNRLWNFCRIGKTSPRLRIAGSP